MKIVVLDGATTDQGALDWDGLAQCGELIVHPRSEPGQVVERARGAEAVLTHKVVLDADVLGQLPGLRYVGVLATGTHAVTEPQVRIESHT